jgi:uncharacterized membrane protein
MKYIKYVILLLVFILSIIFMNHNYGLYNDPIVRVYDIKVINSKIDYNDKLKETLTEESVYVKVMNGKYKGNKLIFKNEESKSGVYENKYHVGDEIFVKLANNGTEISQITNLRRDKYLVPLFVLFVCLLVSIGLKKGLFTFLSLLINIVIISVIVYFRCKGGNILLLFGIGSILMIIISLLFTSGINYKTYVAIISSLLTLGISFIISLILIKIFDNDIPYWYMDYVDVLFDYENVYLASIMLSGLGAIMDVTITISSTLNELICNNKRISDRALKTSGMNVAKDIMGTMVNVLLFTSLIEIIPMLLLTTRNNIPLFTSIRMYGYTEIIRFLTSSIGLLLAVPISLYFSLKLLRGKAKV